MGVTGIYFHKGVCATLLTHHNRFCLVLASECDLFCLSLDFGFVPAPLGLFSCFASTILSLAILNFV